MPREREREREGTSKSMGTFSINNGPSDSVRICPAWNFELKIEFYIPHYHLYTTQTSEPCFQSPFLQGVNLFFSDTLHPTSWTYDMVCRNEVDRNPRIGKTTNSSGHDIQDVFVKLTIYTTSRTVPPCVCQWIHSTLAVSEWKIVATTLHK